MIRTTLLCCLAALCGCTPPAPPLAPSSVAHYTLEPAWQGDGVWFYPRETYELDQTGLASVYGAQGTGQTTDGEAFSNIAMAAAHQTLQLPAIVSVTNLENGYQVRVRVNDRGPATPHRVIELTRKAAGLLGIPPDGTAQVRVQVDAVASQALTQSLGGGAPKLAVTTAPRATVAAESLPGSPGATQPMAARPEAKADNVVAAPVFLPATRMQDMPAPGQLWINAGEFSTRIYADRVRRKLGPDGQLRTMRAGRNPTYQVQGGPYSSVARADSALDQALRAGVTDARIVVE